jgi:hypothetical protein
LAASQSRWLVTVPRARLFQSRDKERILIRHEISELRIPEGGRQSSDIERLLQRYGNTEERMPLAACKRCVSGFRCLARAIEVADNNSIETPV